MRSTCRGSSKHSRKQRGGYHVNCRKAEQPGPPSARSRAFERFRAFERSPQLNDPTISNDYLPSLATTKLFFTEKTLGTPLARKPATFLSVSLSTTPSSVTLPFFTMIWMEGTA